jgi:hypothetical protein
MTALLLLAPIVGAVAFLVIAWWLERFTRRPGLFFLIIGVAGIGGAGLAFVRGIWWLSLLFLLQAIGFLYLARFRHTTTRTERTVPAKPNALG